jgi:hypothetical protein
VEKICKREREKGEELERETKKERKLQLKDQNKRNKVNNRG